MSMNELSSLLKRSFEGLGYCQADCEDAAITVVWLESHGLPGFDIVRSAWRRLSRSSGSSISLSNKELESIVVDGDGSSLLVLGRALIAYATAEAATNFTRIECVNVNDRIAILPSLMDCAEHKIAAICYWRDGRHLHMGFFAPGQDCPDYCVATLGADADLREDAIYIACSNDIGRIRKLYAALPAESDANDVQVHVAGPTMTACRHASVMNGLRIDHALLETLSASAQRVLVESTNQSRRGAGEDKK